jgi:hypothetical protein
VFWLFAVVVICGRYLWPFGAAGSHALVEGIPEGIAHVIPRAALLAVPSLLTPPA